MDITVEADVQRGFAEAREAFGGLDLLVNNAGVEKPFELVDMPLEEWEKVISVNLTGAFLCTREAARIMRADETRGRHRDDLERPRGHPVGAASATTAPPRAG